MIESCSVFGHSEIEITQELEQKENSGAYKAYKYAVKNKKVLINLK